MVGYISPTGEIVDVGKWCDQNHVDVLYSRHFAYCEQCGLDEDFDLLDSGYVKLTSCVKPYVFNGRSLSPEQVEALRALGIEPDEWDLP